MSLDRLVTGAVRPVALLCLVLLAAGVAIGVADPTGNYERYTPLFWAAASAAAVLLAVTAGVPRRPRKRVRTPGFAASGLLLAAVAGNGLTGGLAQLLLWTGAVAAFCVAIPSLLLSMEAVQNRPVSRL